MAASTSSEPSAGDPPLYMSGRTFVELDRHSAASSHSRGAASHQGPGDVDSTLGMHDENPSRSPPAPLSKSVSEAANLAETPPGGQSGTQRSETPDVAGASITDSEAAGYVFQPEEDDELAANVAMLNQHRKWQRRENDEMRLLELTAKQLSEMAANAEGMCDIEYFDAKYFQDETRKVWSERAQEDASPTSTRTVRLLTTGKSSILALAEAKAARAAQVRAAQQPDAESQAMKHPLLHRRAARTEERRAVFRAAALERAAANALPSERTMSAAGTPALDRRSLYSPQRDLFGRSRPLVDLSRSRAQPEASDAGSDSAAGTAPKPLRPAAAPASLSADAASAEATPDSGAEAGSTPAGKTAAPEAEGSKSLGDLLKEQKTLLADMQQHDEDVYRPLLSAFYRYDDAVHDKMNKLLAMVGVESSDEAQPAAEEETTLTQ